jgi:precorrin-4/cobalt-precorrin-4 C11-methyltransferase
MADLPVRFVGAGPGDPELITVKGQKALAAADRVVYAGSLVPEAVLRWCRPDCERIDSAGLHLSEIVTAMAEARAAGRRVVRLHTGDPSLYGAIAEQIAELRDRGIPCEIVPGVTAAFAAAAAMGLEYTLPEATQTLILTRMAGRTPVPEAESLESLARHGASLAIYLSAGMADKVSETLCATYGPDAPAAVAYRVSHPDERIVRTTARQLPEAMAREGIRKHALILVGPALAMAPGDAARKSRLYDAGFSHEYRDASEAS